MEKFKGVYEISKWRGKRTFFHKKYRVFDGLGTVFFDTLVEARGYVVIKSGQLERLYNSSKAIYKKLSECYLEKLIKFRLYDSVNSTVNLLLRDCLDCYKSLSREIFPQYILSKLKCLYDYFMGIAKVLNLKVLYKTIERLKNCFYTPYPHYDSSQRPEAKKVSFNQLGIDNQHQKLAN